jgi:methyl-accepting chemotaxis protein
MDQVTQQNAAMVEETTAAATNLRSEAAELARLVARFDTGARAKETRSRPSLVGGYRDAPAANTVRRS